MTTISYEAARGLRVVELLRENLPEVLCGLIASGERDVAGRLASLMGTTLHREFGDRRGVEVAAAHREPRELLQLVQHERRKLLVGPGDASAAAAIAPELVMPCGSSASSWWATSCRRVEVAAAMASLPRARRSPRPAPAPPPRSASRSTGELVEVATALGELPELLGDVAGERHELRAPTTATARRARRAAPTRRDRRPGGGARTGCANRRDHPRGGRVDQHRVSIGRRCE